uniref:SSD domain-containing protein n=1 Tax=Heterorhabditis bacteriophora TaxID=37862 RepID=A0A1I7WFJ8_HETBA
MTTGFSVGCLLMISCCFYNQFFQGIVTTIFLILIMTFIWRLLVSSSICLTFSSLLHFSSSFSIYFQQFVVLHKKFNHLLYPGYRWLSPSSGRYMFLRLQYSTFISFATISAWISTRTSYFHIVVSCDLFLFFPLCPTCMPLFFCFDSDRNVVFLCPNIFAQSCSLLSYSLDSELFPRYFFSVHRLNRKKYNKHLKIWREKNS